MLTTRRAFMGVTRMCRTRAIDSTISLLLTPPRSAAATLLVVLHVSTEGAGRREFAELVTDHGLGDEHRDVLATVVHRDRVTQHGRDDHRAARPGLDHVLAVGLVRGDHLAKQVLVDEGALLETAWHLLELLLALLAGVATADDELVAFLVGVARTAFLLTPRADRVATTGGLALTTTVRVVDRVHRDTADGRADALPAHTAGLTPVDVRLLGVADLADGCAAAHVNVADFAGRQTQLGEAAFLGNKLDGCAGGAAHLGAATRTQFDCVDYGTDRDVAQRKVVAGLDVSVGAGLYEVALGQLVRGDDVTLGAINVVQEGDPSRAVRVVLDFGNAGVDAVLVVATEVDQTVLALVSTTLVTGR